MKAAVEGRSDEVVAADLADDEWSALRAEHQSVRHRSRASLCSCVDCGHPLHPKEKGRTRFFAHNPDPDNGCPLRHMESTESPDHRTLKLQIYKAVKREPGWRAAVETRGPEPDPVTKRAIIVDVTAERQRARRAGDVAGRLQGWEVQIQPMDSGSALERQEFRRRWLERCTWVTRSDRPVWAGELPWYQVRQAVGTELVVDGVNRWDSGAGAFVNEDPFPADLMVGYMLRGALWTSETGWMLEYASSPRTGRRRQRTETTKSTVAEFCDRLERLPEYARGWTDEDWIRYAPIAHDRRRRGEQLTELERMAISRCPSADPELTPQGYGPHLVADYTGEEIRPCIHCGSPVIVSFALDYPLHHHCAWHLGRGDRCRCLMTGAIS